MRGIYAITNILTDTVYYGQAQIIRKRIDHHRYALRDNKHTNPYLQHSWNKHGADAFVFTALYEVADKSIDLTPLENKCIKEAYNIGLKVFNILDPRSIAGELNPHFGHKHSEETKKRMSDVRKGKVPWNKGKHPPGTKHTEKWKQEASKRMIGNTFGTGRVVSEEERNNTSERLKGNKHSLGIIKTIEQRKAISLRLKGKPKSEQHKKKLSESKIGTKHPMFGKSHSSNTIRKMSEARKLYWDRKK